jgi:hypothetical protein
VLRTAGPIPDGKGRRTATSRGLPHILAGTVTTIADAAELVLKSDAFFREAERCEVFGVRPGHREDAFATGKRYNDLLRTLVADELPSRIRELREDFVGIGEVDAEHALSLAEQTFRERLVEVPLNVDQAKEAESALRRGFEVGRSGGVPLCDSC